MKIILFTILFCVALFCNGQTKQGIQNELSLSEFKFEGIFGSTHLQPNVVYCLLGRGFFRSVQSEDIETITKEWLEDHKQASVIPISSSGPIFTDIQDSKMIYCWIVQGIDTLNTHLVRLGGVTGGTMIYAHNPVNKDNTKLLISKERYNTFIEKVKSAEIYAREHQLRIWRNYDEITK